MRTYNTQCEEKYLQSPKQLSLLQALTHALREGKTNTMRPVQHITNINELVWGLFHPKSIKFSPPASSACPLFDQSAISSFTSFPKASCSFPNSSFVAGHMSNHSSIDGVGLFSSPVVAFLLGHSFGELLPGTTARVRFERRLPAPAVELPEVAAGGSVSALWKFGMKNALVGWQEKSFMASEEQQNTKGAQ